MKVFLKQILSKYAPDEVALAENGGEVHEKYRKSGLTEVQADNIKRSIQHAFEVDKIYRQNELNLLQLANHIHQDRYKISEVINKCYAMNFYALLNHYRIGEAKTLLVSSPFLSVKSVMYEVGFNSKNSFYNAFKKCTGLSPNDYRLMAMYQQPQIA